MTSSPHLQNGCSEGVRAAGGWAMFDLLPPALKGRIDPWGAEPPGMALMRGIKRTLDPQRTPEPGAIRGRNLSATACAPHYSVLNV